MSCSNPACCFTPSTSATSVSTSPASTGSESAISLRRCRAARASESWDSWARDTISSARFMRVIVSCMSLTPISRPRESTPRVASSISSDMSSSRSLA
ncbi:Uncharacterised protein [Mycobacteroides abscessus]|nr:Uncharacterised protein [Mycobacteroides abscessus]